MTELTEARFYTGTECTVAHRGRTLTVKVERDDDMGPPWEEHDGHGPVSDWTTRDKRPGELVLSGTPGRGPCRFYDFAEACRIARTDGWGWLPGEMVTLHRADLVAPDSPNGVWEAKVIGHPDLFATSTTCINGAIRKLYGAHRATMTARQYAAGAALKDFQCLRAWCDDKWEWAGVTVSDDATGESESLWGIEDTSCDGRYLREVAEELADQICDALDEAEAADRDADAEAMAAEIAASRPDLAPRWAQPF